MISSTLSDRKAQLLLRIRWLAWGAIAALLAAHLAVSVAQSAQPEILPLEQSAAHFGVTCGCSHNVETI
ncbi:hypothetical protein EB810_13855 [Altererythrobacter sp. FM1]|uniref:hypothetical protein n=1 Tax=Tsuneonella flava TaxID=2055955 RepID=UPI000C7FC7EC|nr:hypothetical protein [Tsuneonella flava]ROT94149.1 hypothetical protein EB810_13855 [Altererythrobacter sp. FM1]